MKTAFSIIFILILPFVYSKAQSYCPTGKEGNIWYFGGNNAFDTPPIGIDFNDTGSGQPAFLGDGGMQTYEAAAVMCDGDGQLLFTSNGRHVWNRNHEIMPNGMWLDGNQSATHIIALPWPGHDGQYFLIYPEAIEATNLFQNPDDTIRHVYYSIIDMALDGGRGDVTVKDALLHQHTTEKVAAVRHCNGEDWWVITHGSPGNTFHAWLLDENGLAAQSVDSQVGKWNNGINYIFNSGGINGILGPAGNTSSSLQFSPDGQILAMATLGSITFWGGATFDGFFELFRFDNATGAISEPMLVLDSLRSIYGVAFSPDNSKLYCKVWDPWERVLQYNVAIWNIDSITASKFVIADTNITSNAGAMQLGPDGRIYIANAHYYVIPHDGLDVIDHPNEKGAACGYRPARTGEGYLVPPSSEAECGLGMPTFPASYYAPLKPYLKGPRQVCAGEIITYQVTGNCAPVDFLWAASGGEVLLEEGDTAWVRFASPGIQKVIAQRVTPCATFSDTLLVSVYGGTTTPDTVFICQGDSVEVFGELIIEEGVFTENSTTSFGCDSIAIVQVLLFPTVDTTFLSTTTCDEMNAGIFPQAFINENGCDSIVINIVSLQEVDTTFIASTSCDPSAIGVFTETYSSINGCDSVVAETIVLLDIDTTYLMTATCDPSDVGVFTETFINENGCDSLVVETVVLLIADTTYLESNTCDPIAAGVFTETLSSANGCDSVIVQTVALLETDSTYLSSTTCDPAAAGTFIEIYSNTKGCDSVVVEVVRELSTLVLDLGEDVSIFAGESTMLVPSISPSNGSVLSWEWWPIPCPECTQLLVSPTVDTYYGLTVTSSDGCTSSDEVLVEVGVQKEDVYFPSAFSPNGDMVNDHFTIYGRPNGVVLSLLVFDRWGGMVFESHEFPFNNETAGWDGTSNGERLNQGVFVFFAEIQLPKGEIKHIKGDVVLIR